MMVFMFHSGDTTKFKAGDTVYNFKNKIIFVIDSANKQFKQKFYHAHYINGIRCHKLPERDLQKNK